MSRILIIEDDALTARVYRTRLEKEGYEVDVCADGQAGFYRLHEKPPDAVLLDLMLPQMNGVLILKKIRAQQQFRGLPVLVYTNAYLPAMVQAAVNAGANWVFNKACLQPSQLVGAFHQALHPDFGAAVSVSSSGSTVAAAAPAAMAEAGAPRGELAERLMHSVLHPAGKVTPYPATGRVAIMPAEAVEKDPASPGQLMKSFREMASQTLRVMFEEMQRLSKANDDKARLAQVRALYGKVHLLAGSAGVAGVQPVAEMAGVLEALLKELTQIPKVLTPSSLRTVAAAIDLLADLVRNPNLDLSTDEPSAVLVVDDDMLARRAMAYALEKAHLRATCLDNPNTAFETLSQEPFALVFLDVQMPGMTGYDLCKKIRELPQYQETPIIFVTSLRDFSNRVKSNLVGGSDFITKPFLFLEVSTKAMTWLARTRLDQQARQRAA